MLCFVLFKFISVTNNLNLSFRRRFNRREAMPLAQAGLQGELEGGDEVVEDAQVTIQVLIVTI